MTLNRVKIDPLFFRFPRIRGNYAGSSPSPSYLCSSSRATMSMSPRWSFLSVSATRACSSSTTKRSPAGFFVDAVCCSSSIRLASVMISRRVCTGSALQTSQISKNSDRRTGALRALRISRTRLYPIALFDARSIAELFIPARLITLSSIFADTSSTIVRSRLFVLMSPTIADTPSTCYKI